MRREGSVGEVRKLTFFPVMDDSFLFELLIFCEKIYATVNVWVQVDFSIETNSVGKFPFFRHVFRVCSFLQKKLAFSCAKLRVPMK